ncbi:MAG TPA: TPM domain-containing protein [Pyrinomonadaceae bacterium]|jgi:uncharacterized membrane protein YgcG|nr:TPM domain-containing protein [Pyrinomonadaceae bacterium]
MNLTSLKKLLTVCALALSCACRPSVSTQDAAAAQKGLVAQTNAAAQTSAAAQAKPSLCKGQASPLPKPTGYVNDYARVIDARTKQGLEEKLEALKKSSGVEFAVVTVETTGGRDIFDYSIDVACGWGLGPAAGQRGGGVLLLVATKDRRWRVQVSRSLEADLPDAAVAEIGERMMPFFRRGEYGEGILRCVDDHIARLSERGKVPAKP